ncbi:MAG: DUF2034 domain-containing protein [Proteobacteria bacterium]|nr:DUF2034 domain-containing protein [Pseudomonadota bacterium]
MLKGQTDINSIRNLSWRSFEDLIGEVYRRDGYSIEGNTNLGADGGIDIIAKKDGETILVQCKHWKAYKIGVKTVREMFGLLNAEKANEVHIMSSGYFTNEANDFARGKPIQMIDGKMLVQLINKAQEVKSKGSPAKDSTSKSQKRIMCPKCGSDMVLKKTSKGVNDVKELWACTKFLSCNGTREIIQRK